MKKELCIVFGKKMGFAYSYEVRDGHKIFSSTVCLRNASPNEFKILLNKIMTLVGDSVKVFYLSQPDDDIRDLSLSLIDTCQASGIECIEINKSDIMKAAALEMELGNSNYDEMEKYISSCSPKSANEALAIGALKYLAENFIGG